MSSSPNESRDNSVSLIAWGDPLDPRTYSGCSRGLGLAMQERRLLRRAFSAKQVHMRDFFRGAVSLRMQNGRAKMQVRRQWMWSARGNELLTRRLNDVISPSGDRGNFFQVGTLIEIDPQLGRQYALTDMTIPQAFRAGRFRFDNVSRQHYDQAVAVQRRVLHSLSHVFTFTEWARSSVIEDFGVDPQRVTAVYTGANHHFSPNGHITRKPQQILFVGIDWERKGGPQLVEGFRKLRERLPGAELVIVGCSPRVSMPGVNVIGYLHPGKDEDRRRLADLYLESTCFALMSDFEPLGNVICEAYSAGLPVVAFSSGSRPEVISDGQTGILCSDREPQTIADALYRLLHDRGTLAQMGRQAKTMYETKLSWPRVVDRIAAVLQQNGHGNNGKVTGVTNV